MVKFGNLPQFTRSPCTICESLTVIFIKYLGLKDHEMDFEDQLFFYKSSLTCRKCLCASLYYYYKLKLYREENKNFQVSDIPPLYCPLYIDISVLFRTQCNNSTIFQTRSTEFSLKNLIFSRNRFYHLLYNISQSRAAQMR